MNTRAKRCRVWVAWRLKQGFITTEQLINVSLSKKKARDRFTELEVQLAVSTMIADQRVTKDDNGILQMREVLQDCITPVFDTLIGKWIAKKSNDRVSVESFESVVSLTANINVLTWEHTS
jgi:hypothetical protein